MSKTKLWSLQFSCRRLAREARSLGRIPDQSGAAAREVEQHLATAAQLIAGSLEQLGAAVPQGIAGQTADPSQFAFGDNAWASRSPLVDYKAPQESPPSPKHRLGLRVGSGFVATPDLITFLCSLQKSGVLLIDTIDERFTVELEQGDIVHAHSDGAPEGERLGDVLVEQGALARADLDAMLTESVRGFGGERLGARLIERGLATREHILQALETQIRRLFQRLFRVQATVLVFWEGAPVWGEPDVRLNATMLLLDGARAMDESSRAGSGAAAALAQLEPVAAPAEPPAVGAAATPAAATAPGTQPTTERTAVVAPVAEPAVAAATAPTSVPVSLLPTIPSIDDRTGAAAGPANVRSGG